MSTQAQQAQVFNFNGKTSKDIVFLAHSTPDDNFRAQALQHALTKIEKMTTEGKPVWKVQLWAKAVTQIQAIIAGVPLAPLSPVIGSRSAATYTQTPVTRVAKPKAAPKAPAKNQQLDQILAALGGISSTLNNLDTRLTALEAAE